MKPRQVPIFLYWRVENVQFWINSIGYLGWLNCILNFPRFHKNVNSLELWKYISEKSSPKGSCWRNKRKSEFSSLSADSRYLLAVALKPSRNFIRQATVERLNFHRNLWAIACKHLSSLPNFLHNKSLLRFQFIHGKHRQAFLKVYCN